ncbi:complement factor H-like, partial [Tachysurus ichikawai]
PENCRRPDLKKGFFVPQQDIYEHGVTVSYGCDSGLKPALETWWGQITCSNGLWSHTPQCIEKTWCIPPHVPNAQTTYKLDLSYSPGSTLRFQCNVAYEFEGTSEVAVCEDGKWKLPRCKRKRYSCDPPLRVDYGMIKQPYQDAFVEGHRLDYVCAKGYKISGREYSYCSSGKWTDTIKCETITCPKPRVQHTEAEKLKVSYDIGERVQFRCLPSYEFEGSDIAECVDGSWRLPACRPRGESRCREPSIQNGRRAAGSGLSFATGSSVKFECDDGFVFEGANYAQCNNGQWKLPVCK